MNNFNICEILGVDIDEHFIFRKEKYKINDVGFVQGADNDFIYAGMPTVCEMINNPQEIEKVFKFNEGEKYILKAFPKARYITRDVNSSIVHLWKESLPWIAEDGTFHNGTTSLAYFASELFPNIKEGQLIKITEELLND